MSLQHNPKGRNLLVDALRGLCFVLMTVDHLPDNPRLVGMFTNWVYGPFGFFTSASGFYFLSGWVSGKVYEKHRQLYGSKATIRRVLSRIRDIYLTHMGLFLAIFVAVLLRLPGSANWHHVFFTQHPSGALLYGALLLHEPGFLGLLPMYCLFLAVTPLLLRQFEAGKTLWVLTGSVALWIASGLTKIRMPEDAAASVTFGGLNPLAYQILFVFGLALGANRIAIQRLGAVAHKQLLVWSFATTAILFLLRQGYAVSGTVQTFLGPEEKWFSVWQNGPLRVLNFAAFAVTLYWCSRKVNWTNVQSPLFRWLVFLGQHSLPVFAGSILITYFYRAVLPLHSGTILQTASLLVGVASLSIPALLHANLKLFIHTLKLRLRPA